ncbi:response regulator [Spirosoma radiotolerans]|uniref:Response regulatory domain-containing protein n=1 Tax=Spirosoma radiotolerans TaxID=1379870 RepID=A0A0E3ZYG4_9BACT|nr:response regulator [Spirosoma radiotolerans]AKD57428.1 hypothetical protein SD10_23600 [Spirosoma radiotolerans]
MDTYRIVLSDDDEDDCYFLTTIFKDLYGDRVEISCSKNLQECQRLLAESEQPHLVVLDYFLPPANALDLLGWMSTQPHLQSVPTVLWSSLITAEELSASFQAGMVDFIPKQSDYKAMKEVIRSLMDKWVVAV